MIQLFWLRLSASRVSARSLSSAIDGTTWCMRSTLMLRPPPPRSCVKTLFADARNRTRGDARVNGEPPCEPPRSLSQAVRPRVRSNVPYEGPEHGAGMASPRSVLLSRPLKARAAFPRTTHVELVSPRRCRQNEMPSTQALVLSSLSPNHRTSGRPHASSAYFRGAIRASRQAHLCMWHTGVKFFVCSLKEDDYGERSNICPRMGAQGSVMDMTTPFCLRFRCWS